MTARTTDTIIATESEIKIDGLNDFKFTIGSMNKHKPTAVYLQVSTWITSKEPLTQTKLNYMSKQISKRLYDSNDLVFNCDRTIVLVESSDSDLRSYNSNVPHFFTVELTMYQLRGERVLDWSNYNLQVYLQLYAEEVCDYLMLDKDLKFSIKRNKHLELHI